MNVILYSTGCPKCSVLKKKLDEKSIQYTIESNEEKMMTLGIFTVPVLSVDGSMMSFTNAVRWLNEYNEG